MRGAADVMRDAVSDLRDHQPLVDLLPGRQAIYDGHPAEDRGYAAEVAITTVSNTSTPHRGATTRTYRLQATIKTTREWREGHEPAQSGTAAMAEIHGRIAERFDHASGLSAEGSRGGIGGPDPQRLDDGRLAITSDWIVFGAYSRA